MQQESVTPQFLHANEQAIWSHIYCRSKLNMQIVPTLGSKGLMDIFQELKKPHNYLGELNDDFDLLLQLCVDWQHLRMADESKGQDRDCVRRL